MFTSLFSLLTNFESIKDPRQDAKVLHQLDEMIYVTLCAAIANCDTWTDVEIYANQNMDWFRETLQLKNGIPSHDTFGRLFARLDTREFTQCLTQWTESLQLSLEGQGVHIDGKVLRRSFDKAAGKSALQVVTAWAGDLHLCLGQLAVAEGSNELTAVPELLDMLELSGAVVTLDALHTQKATAKKIREKAANYVLTVKGNQKKLYRAINKKFEELSEEDFQNSRARSQVTHETNGGREEYRRYTVFPAPAAIRQLGWTDLQAIGMVYRERTVNGKMSQELTYFISSLPPKVRLLAKHVRDHWKVENQMHWSLDVTFAEDTSRIRKGNAPMIAGIFRRLALSILKRDTTDTCSIRQKRLKSSWSPANLTQYLTGKTP